VTVTMTLATTAPDASVTVPRIVPKTVCPRPGVARHTASTVTLNATTQGLSFIEILRSSKSAPRSPLRRKPVTYREMGAAYARCESTVKIKKCRQDQKVQN